MKSPLVVGYKGEIGSFILNGLLKVMPKASNIWCIDINETEEEKLERIKKADYIFLCVPLQDTVDWLIKYKPFLKDKIIVEQCSLKSLIYEDKRIKDLNYISMHLLFRPSVTSNRKDRECIFIDRGRERRIADELSNMLHFSYNFLYNYKEHDKLMAEKQALVHKVILALAKTIEYPADVNTYVSSHIITLASRIKQGDKTLYKMIQENKYAKNVLERFKKNLKGDKDDKK